MELTATILGILGAILLTLAYLLIQFKHLSSDTKLYDYMNLFGSSLILYSLFFNWNTGAALIEMSWIAISIFTILSVKSKRSNNEKIGNLNAQYENLSDTHYLKYFNNYDIDYNVGEEYQKIFNFNLASSDKIPYFVRLFENPSKSWFLPFIFKGRVSLKQHDFIHLLMSRGFNIVDEIAVIAVSMGSSKQMNFFNTFVFYIAQWLFYDKYFRFPLKYYPLFKLYVKFGHNMTKNLSKVKPEEWYDYQMSDLRKKFGIFKPDLIEILKIEVLIFGVNGRMLDNLEITHNDVATLEENTEEIVIYSKNLHNDLLIPNIMNTVANNLKSGVRYKYILPDNKDNIKRKERLLELHKSNENLSVILIDEEDYNRRYEEYEEYVFYDNLIYIIEKDNKILIHSAI